jgi:hypothetical protein
VGLPNTISSVSHYNRSVIHANPCTFTKSARAKIIAVLISDALPFGRLWHGEPDAVIGAIGYAQSRR